MINQLTFFDIRDPASRPSTQPPLATGRPGAPPLLRPHYHRAFPPPVPRHILHIRMSRARSPPFARRTVAAPPPPAPQAAPIGQAGEEAASVVGVPAGMALGVQMAAIR